MHSRSVLRRRLFFFKREAGIAGVVDFPLELDEIVTGVVVH